MIQQVKSIRLLFFLLIFAWPASAQLAKDTIRLDVRELLILSDTIYSGTQDSIILLNKGTAYQIQQNYFYQDKGKTKKEEATNDTLENSVNKLKKFVLEQVYDTKVTIPKGFNASDEYFKKYEGKIIKNVLYNRVKVLDGDVYNASEATSTTFGRFLNKTYSPTKVKVLENNIRFTIRDTINSRIMSDNERILRNLPFIEEAKIYVLPFANSPDTVNILVVTKDKYPFGVSGDVNDYNYFSVEPYTRNFMGMGHRIGATLQYKGSVEPALGYGVDYSAENIMGTFTTAEVGYFNSYDNTYLKTKLERPFLSTDTKYGGEFTYENVDSYRYTFHYAPDSVYETKDRFKANTYDMWLGYSIFISKDITKPFLNVAGRYFNEKYSVRPKIDPGTNFDFHDKSTLLGSVSYQKISYFETTKLRGFGVIEYVPVGFNINITSGWQSTSFYKRPYFGTGVNYSVFVPKTGIFAVLLDVGGYYRQASFEDFVTNFRFNYFSPLIALNRFELRNEFTFTLNNTINPLYHRKVSLSRILNGFKKSPLYGNGTFVLNYHPVFHTPYDLLGFKFSFKPFVDLGWISEKDFLGGSKQFYSVYGLGLSLKNESLIFPAMNMYAGYYPNGTASGGNFGFEIVFRDYKILDFFSELKPKTASPWDLK